MDSLEKIAEEIRNCRKCSLAKTRTNAVPGEGDISRGIMFVGEAPGRNEDLQGRPFVGQAGKLLEDMLRSIGLSRDDVFITNVVKCRPPNNRNPTEWEIFICSPYLERQLKVIRPKIVCTLGFFSTKYMMGRFGVEVKSISRVQGRIYNFEEFSILPMYHPAAILYKRNLEKKFREGFEKLREFLREKEIL